MRWGWTRFIPVSSGDPLNRRHLFRGGARARRHGNAGPQCHCAAVPRPKAGTRAHPSIVYPTESEYQMSPRGLPPTRLHPQKTGDIIAPGSPIRPAEIFPVPFQIDKVSDGVFFPRLFGEVSAEDLRGIREAALAHPDYDPNSKALVDCREAEFLATEKTLSAAGKTKA